MTHLPRPQFSKSSIPNDFSVILKIAITKKLLHASQSAHLPDNNIIFISSIIDQIYQAYDTCAVSIPGRYSDELLALVLAPAVTEVWGLWM